MLTNMDMLKLVVECKEKHPDSSPLAIFAMAAQKINITIPELQDACNQANRAAVKLLAAIKKSPT